MTERIGHLVIEDKLGEGGMGIVYRAHDTRLGRAVALKVLPDSMAASRDAMARFEREARLLASLNHPNVAAIYGLESDGERTALVLELIEGRSLWELLRDGPPELATALDICWQVSCGLEAAHNAGITHRDLKPSNVMVTEDGRVKLLDFGLARRDEPAAASAAATEADTQTRVGAILGSPGYMSPEQVMGASAEPRTDLWGFGCILYECLAGRRAFPGEDTVQSVHAVLYEDVDLTRLPPETPPMVCELITACLARQIEDRPPSARHVRLLLEGELGGSLTPPTLVEGARTVLRPAPTPHNLPEELTSFVGREEECRRLRELFLESRLISLTGVGGCGKSRLGLHLARALVADHPGGVWLLDVASLAGGDALPGAIGDLLGVKGDDSETPLEPVLRRLQHERVLFVLDNCEYQLPAVSQVVQQLLARCSKLRLLVTSRESLDIRGEHVHLVPSLSVPPERAPAEPEHLNRFESVRLLVERARQVNPELTVTSENAAAIAAICRRLDGLPLALELAAGRCRVLSLEQIVARLDDAFKLLRRSGRATNEIRPQTLEAVIAWSYEHSSEDEQELLQALAVFASGWDLSAAAAICGEELDEFDLLDLLDELVRKSMVVVEESAPGEPRYRLLQTVRQFALTRLEASGRAAILRERHCHYYLELARGTANRFYGEERAEMFDMLERERGNLHQALDHRLADPAGGDEALAAATAISLFWLHKSRASAGVSYLVRALEHSGAQARDERRRVGLNYLAYLATHTGRYEIARKAVEESCDIAAESSDPGTIASSLHYCGELALYLDNFAEAEEIYTRNLEILRGLGAPRRVAACLQNLGQVKTDLGKLDEARAAYNEALRINRQEGNRGWAAYNLHGLATIAQAADDLPDAERLYGEALQIFRELEDLPFLELTLHDLGTLALVSGDFERARRLQLEAFQLVSQTDDRGTEAGILRELTELALAEGDVERARSLLARALEACTAADLSRPDRRVVRCLVTSSRLAARIAGRAEAELLRGAAAAVAGSMGAHALQREAVDREDTDWRLPPDPVTEAWQRGQSLNTAAAVARARSLLSGSRRPI